MVSGVVGIGLEGSHVFLTLKPKRVKNADSKETTTVHLMAEAKGTVVVDSRRLDATLTGTKMTTETNGKAKDDSRAALFQGCTWKTWHT